jgi:hypothetical protein
MIDVEFADWESGATVSCASPCSPWWEFQSSPDLGVGRYGASYKA